MMIPCSVNYVTHLFHCDVFKAKLFAVPAWVTTLLSCLIILLVSLSQVSKTFVSSTSLCCKQVKKRALCTNMAHVTAKRSWIVSHSLMWPLGFNKSWDWHWFHLRSQQSKCLASNCVVQFVWPGCLCVQDRDVCEEWWTVRHNLGWHLSNLTDRLPTIIRSENKLQRYIHWLNCCVDVQEGWFGVMKGLNENWRNQKIKKGCC